MPRRRPTESPHSQDSEMMATCSSSGSEPELAHPFQGQHDIGDLMLGVGTERVERLVNPFCRDCRLPEKGPEAAAVAMRHSPLSVGANMTS